MGSIKSAIDKTSYWINQAIEIHGDKYDYSKVVYINNRTKIIIICPIHGEFLQTPDKHLLKRGCHTCGKINGGRKCSFEEFVSKANIVHSCRYKYPSNDYTNAKTLMEIFCDTHGSFFQLPDVHLRGSGCPKCGYRLVSEKFKALSVGWRWEDWEKRAKQSKNFDSFKVYIIRCWNENEEFYKIGRTFSTVETRFKTKQLMPYNYEIIRTIEGEVELVYALESKLQTQYEEFKYEPLLGFPGQYECFSYIELLSMSK